MSWWSWLNPWSGTEEARRALEGALADEQKVKSLARELEKIEKENHITARVHAAFRGE